MEEREMTTKAVPVEPTKEMLLAGQDALDDCVDSDWDSGPDGNGHNSYMTIRSDAAAVVWRAMLAAAPAP